MYLACGLVGLGAPLIHDTYATAVPRRGIMRID
jgi:hypothetical protein